MTVELAVSLDRAGCMGATWTELTGEDPREKRWFRDWLEERLSRSALVLCGRRTVAAMDRYALRLQEAFPNSPWVILSRKGPSLTGALAQGESRGLRMAVLLGGLGVFREALERGLVHRVWVARLALRRGGDLIFPEELLGGARVVERVRYPGFELEIYDTVNLE